ncbi:MAG: hypothetical protein JSW07_11085, partial [bacterium]
MVIILTLLSVNVSAQNQLTIPVYHWAYPYIHQLRLSGYLDELNTIQQPYTMAQLLNNLTSLQQQIQQGIIKPTRQDQWLIGFLMTAFNSEKDSSSGDKQLTIQPGLWADELIINDHNETKF